MVAWGRHWGKSSYWGECLDTLTLHYGEVTEDPPSHTIRTPEDCLIEKQIDDRNFTFDPVKSHPEMLKALDAPQPSPIRFYGVFWGVESGTRRSIFFAFPNGTAHDIPFDEKYEKEYLAFAHAVNQRNERLGLKFPGMGGAVAIIPPQTRKLALPPLAENVFTGASRLEQGLSFSFARLPRWTDDDGKRIFHHEGQRKNFRVTTSMPEAAWEQLKGQPATVVKAWHVLEATRHETGDPMSPFTITPDRILREIKGDRKSKFLPKEKQDATDMLNAILQMSCVMHWKDQAGKMHRTNGAVYLRTTNDETHEDLFGWVPNAMRIMVNPDLFDGKQSEFARQRAPYHKKFLAFNAQKDAGAIYIGSWILTKCRPQSQQWEPGEARIKNSTLLKILVETGVTDLKGYADRRQLCKIPDIVTRDLEKLRAVRLIESYESVGRGGTNTEDFEDGTLDEIEDILKAFPDDLPIRSDPKRKGPDGKAHRGKFAQWLNQTTRIQLGGAAEAAQVKARAAAKDAKALAARRQARKGKLAGSKRETRR